MVEINPQKLEIKAETTKDILSNWDVIASQIRGWLDPQLHPELKDEFEGAFHLFRNALKYNSRQVYAFHILGQDGISYAIGYSVGGGRAVLMDKSGEFFAPSNYSWDDGKESPVEDPRTTCRKSLRYRYLLSWEKIGR